MSKVFLRLGPGGFPTLGASRGFSHAWDQLEVLLRSELVGGFRAPGTSWTLSRTWRRSHGVASSSAWLTVVFVIG